MPIKIQPKENCVLNILLKYICTVVQAFKFYNKTNSLIKWMKLRHDSKNKIILYNAELHLISG